MSKAYDNAKELNFINFDSANNRLNFGLPITSNGANISTDITVYGANSTSNTYFALPTGNLVSRPASPPLGAMRYNTTNGWPEIYTTNGWQAFAAQPYITSVSPTVIAGNSNAVIDIYGINFGVEAQVYFIDNFNNAYLANTVTYYSNTRISAPTPRDFLVGVEPLDVKVVQNSGMYILENAIDCGSVPTWVTTAGSLGSIFGANTVNVYVSATDAESSVTYSLTSGSLPGGLTFSSNGLVQGVATGVQATTTYNFTIKASDIATNNVDRAFSYQILNRVPVFNTASSLSTITDSMLDGYSANVSINAYDPDGGVITYAVTVGSVPTGFTFNTSNGALQLTDANTAERTTNTTSTFTVSATDVGSGVETRQFNITVEHPKDQDFSNTVLLLSATDSNTVLKDASSNNLNLTVVGNARATNFSPYNTSWSFYFPNTLLSGSNQTYSNFITISNTNVNLSGSNYTIEAWVYPTALPSGSPPQEGLSVLSWFAALDNRTWLAISPAGKFSWGYDSPPTGLTGNSTIPLNQWTHVAVTWDGTTTRLLVNGIIDGTSSTNFARNLSTLYIGKAPYNSGTITDLMGWQGFISNLRIIKGTALYTANTTINSPLTVVANTVLLTANGNRFVDFSNNQLALSINGSTAVRGLSPFAETDANTGSMYFDGTGDYILTPNNAITSFNFGNDPFTIEAWVYFNSVSGQQCIITNYSGSTNGWAIQLASGGIGVNLSGDQFDISGPANIIPNRWYHIALSGTPGATGIKLFIDGVQQSTTYTGAVSLDSSASLTIGTIPGGADVNGYISDVRVIRGTALYTANFAVPTIASTNVANTKLLTLQNRQPHNNHGIQDSSRNKYILTRYGNLSQGTFSPFSADANSWSVLVPETLGERIEYNANSNFNFGTGQYSVDAWVYITGTNTNNGYGPKTIFSQGNNATNQLLYLYMDSTNRFVSFGGSGSTLQSYNNVMNRNEWTHIAVTRDASNVERMFINGKLVNSRVNTTNWGTFVTDYAIRIGSNYDSNYPGVYGFSAYAGQLAGYVSNLRINIGSIPTELQTSSNTANAVIFVSPTSVVQDANTKLLMCRNNRHTDSSIYNWTPSTVGTSIRVLPFSPFSPNTIYSASANGGSAYFDGSGDYLEYTSWPISHRLSNKNFTWEAWVYPTTTSGGSLAYLDGNSGNGYAAVRLRLQGTTLELYMSTSGSSWTINGLSGGTVTPFQWNHIALVRTQSTVKLYVNGLERGSSASLGSSTLQNGDVRIGGSNSGAGGAMGEFFTGYMTDYELTLGEAIYTANFAPPSIVATATSNTVLLLPFNNAAIDDYTGKNNIETVGDAKANGVITKFAPGSFSLDGSSDGLVFPTSSGLFAFGTNNFTIEFWAYSNANQSNFTKYFCTGGSVGNIFIDQQTTANRICVNDGSTVFLESTSGITNQVWNHVAIVRSGTTLTIYINGVAVGSATNSTSFTAASTAGVGSNISGGQTFNGVLSDFRVTRAARYTANFTPRPRKLPRR